MESVIAELTTQFTCLLAQADAAAGGINAAQIVSRVAHIFSAIILVGGLFYLRTVLAPAGVDACFADRRAAWAKWVGIASALLLISGIYNFLAINSAAKVDGGKLVPTYHMLFGIKFLLALFLMFIASILAGRTPLAEKFRGNMKGWLNIGLLVATGILVLAAILRTLH